ncbi:MAG TPA: hypothetical protein VEC60_01205 [Reyranella sp.]|nr:hypothetical protein [Reyranella sp.]
MTELILHDDIRFAAGVPLERTATTLDINFQIEDRHGPLDPRPGSMINDFDDTLSDLDRGRSVKVDGKALRHSASPYHGESPSPLGRFGEDGHKSEVSQLTSINRPQIEGLEGATPEAEAA